jgi:transposase
MTRLRGRSLRGKRLYASAPCGRWQTTTMIGAVRQNGQTACMTIEGAINAEVFRLYVRDVLLPTLQAGDILVMDNLSSHKDRQSLEMLKQAGVTVRFLPVYSPDYNPIELMWSKVKALLRKIESRTNDALSQITQKDATHWLAHCGYGFI